MNHFQNKQNLDELTEKVKNKLSLMRGLWIFVPMSLLLTIPMLVGQYAAIQRLPNNMVMDMSATYLCVGSNVIFLLGSLWMYVDYWQSKKMLKTTEALLAQDVGSTHGRAIAGLSLNLAHESRALRIRKVGKVPLLVFGGLSLLMGSGITLVGVWFLLRLEMWGGGLLLSGAFWVILSLFLLKGGNSITKEKQSIVDNLQQELNTLKNLQHAEAGSISVAAPAQDGQLSQSQHVQSGSLSDSEARVEFDFDAQEQADEVLDESVASQEHHHE